MKKLDMIVKNGLVADPRAGVWEKGDVGIALGLSAGLVGPDAEAGCVIDASGCLVLPGLVDFHTHVFRSGSGISVLPDSLLAMGVTTAADAGSAGCANYRAFHRAEIENSALRILSQLNVCSYGQPGAFQEVLDPERFEEDEIAALTREFAGEITGLKLRIGAEVVCEHGLKPLRRTKELSEKLGRPMVVHISNPPSPESEVAAYFERGDVFCHCFHGKGGYTIIGADGRVLPEVRAARERGVLFDCANGITNYNHAVARAALADGFEPDIISTDMCRTVCNRDGFGRSLTYVMSKYMYLGMPLESVVRAVTETPARALGLDGRAGTLMPGAFGDLTVCRIEDAAPVYLDNFGEKMSGDRLIVPLMTVKGGEIVYRSLKF